MKAVIQRVKKAVVHVDEKEIASIGPGLLTFLGIAKGDTEADLQKLIEKILVLRVFEDAQGKMNLSLGDVGGSHLIVSQFTLLGDCWTGRRPSFGGAESPELAEPLYESAIRMSTEQGIPTFGGRFGADMKVDLLNDGPVTLLLETR